VIPSVKEPSCKSRCVAMREPGQTKLGKQRRRCCGEPGLAQILFYRFLITRSNLLACLHAAAALSFSHIINLASCHVTTPNAGQASVDKKQCTQFLSWEEGATATASHLHPSTYTRTTRPRAGMNVGQTPGAKREQRPKVHGREVSWCLG
jgi:hypothetical protein